MAIINKIVKNDTAYDIQDARVDDLKSIYEAEFGISEYADVRAAYLQGDTVVVNYNGKEYHQSSYINGVFKFDNINAELTNKGFDTVLDDLAYNELVLAPEGWSENHYGANKVFVAKFGDTSYLDVKAAVDAGKIIFCDYNGTVYAVCTYKNDIGGAYQFSGINSSYAVFTLTLDKNTGWSAATKDLQTKLTAGANITIQDGVISATGGGSGESIEWLQPNRDDKLLNIMATSESPLSDVYIEGVTDTSSASIDIYSDENEGHIELLAEHDGDYITARLEPTGLSFESGSGSAAITVDGEELATKSYVDEHSGGGSVEPDNFSLRLNGEGKLESVLGAGINYIDEQHSYPLTRSNNWGASVSFDGILSAAFEAFNNATGIDMTIDGDVVLQIPNEFITYDGSTGLPIIQTGEGQDLSFWFNDQMYLVKVETTTSNANRLTITFESEEVKPFISTDRVVTAEVKVEGEEIVPIDSRFLPQSEGGAFVFYRDEYEPAILVDFINDALANNKQVVFIDIPQGKDYQVAMPLIYWTGSAFYFSAVRNEKEITSSLQISSGVWTLFTTNEADTAYTAGTGIKITNHQISADGKIAYTTPNLLTATKANKISTVINDATYYLASKTQSASAKVYGGLYLTQTLTNDESAIWYANPESYALYQNRNVPGLQSREEPTFNDLYSMLFNKSGNPMYNTLIQIASGNALKPSFFNISTGSEIKLSATGVGLATAYAAGNYAFGYIDTNGDAHYAASVKTYGVYGGSQQLTFNYTTDIAEAMTFTVESVNTDVATTVSEMVPEIPYAFNGGYPFKYKGEAGGSSLNSYAIDLYTGAIAAATMLITTSYEIADLDTLLAFLDDKGFARNPDTGDIKRYPISHMLDAADSVYNYCYIDKWYEDDGLHSSFVIHDCKLETNLNVSSVVITEL